MSAFYHDSAACLVRDGEIVAAAQEERFTRKKGDDAFPTLAVEYCLREAAATIDDIEAVVFYDKPLLKFERILETYLGVAPRGFGSFLKAGPLWLKKNSIQTARFVTRSAISRAKSFTPSITSRTRRVLSIRHRSMKQQSSPSMASVNGRRHRSESEKANPSS